MHEGTNAIQSSGSSKLALSVSSYRNAVPVAKASWGDRLAP